MICLKTQILFIWLLCVISISSAQNFISGKITDGNTAEALPYAHVFIPELQTGTLSNDSGFFQVRVNAKGTFHIQFSYLGYETDIKQVILGTGNLSLDISLNSSVIESHDIVISTGYPGKQDENPVKVVQVPKMVLEHSGAPTLMSTLSTIPGIQMINSGGNTGKPVIRGLGYNRVVTFAQGVRIENQQWGDEHGLGITNIGIEKIEIVKGPSSLLYGSDAMGGVIHVYDEKPAAQGKIEGDYGAKYFSNSLGIFSDGGIKASGKVFRGGIRAGYQNHADYAMGGKQGRASNSRFDERTLKANVGINLPWLISGFRYGYNASVSGIPAEKTIQNIERKHILGYQPMAMHLVSTENTILIKSHRIKLNAGLNLSGRKEFDLAPDSSGNIPNNPEPNLDMRLKTINYDLKWYVPSWKKWEPVLGVQGLHQQNKNLGEEVLIPDAEMNDLGGLALIKRNSSRASFQGGIRYDTRQLHSFFMAGDSGEIKFVDFKRKYASLNGSIGGVVNVSDQFLMRLNLASGFRAPNLAELSSNGVHEGTYRYERGSSNLKKEQNLEADLGTHFHGTHMSIDLNGYVNFIRNFIYLNPSTDSVNGYEIWNYLQENALLYGGEALLDLHPHPLDWLHLESAFAIVIGQRMSGNPLPVIPMPRFTQHIKGEFKKWKFLRNPFFDAAFSYSFTQNRVAIGETSSPAYFLFDLTLGSEIKVRKHNWIATISGTNLTNTKYYDHLFRAKTAGLFNMGRNVMFGLRIPFGG